MNDSDRKELVAYRLNKANKTPAIKTIASLYSSLMEFPFRCGQRFYKYRNQIE